MTAYSAQGTGNPIIRHKFTADPTAIVYEDVVYLYTGHDQAPVGIEDYMMEEWPCFSSADFTTMMIQLNG